MLKPTIRTLLAIASFALASFAVVPASLAADNDPNYGPNDACMKSAYDLADEAEKKQLSDAKLEQLDSMFNTMEKHCKALELPQAERVAAQIKSLIDTGN